MLLVLATPLVAAVAPARAEWTAINLHPASEPAGSFLFGVADGQQVGVVHRFEDLGDLAGVWSGTAASYVSLNPFESLSLARGISQGKQVGYLDSPGQNRQAVIWSGAANSYVSLHPAGTYASAALGAGGNQQVGEVLLDELSGEPHASLWTGTAESWVDLNPDPTELFTGSQVWGVYGGYQVGQADTQFNADGSAHAAFWHGTPESWVDLESFLPANYIGSNAFGVWVDGDTIYVAGGAFNNTLNRTEAILWTYTVPEPASFALLAIGLPLLVCRNLLHKTERRIS